ncbi:MAG: ferredoxin-type protein NapG [Verrucomicrobiales bacterium]|jgi:ferredoxin-type protein NapG
MPEFNRRQLFRFSLGDLVREVTKAASPPEAVDAHEPRPPRPPGALPDEEAFLNACARCFTCAVACPFDAIDQYGPASGSLEGTPFIDPAAAPCHWCEAMPCISACSSGALRREEAQPVRPIATVTLKLDRCLNTEGILCDTCSYRCPENIHAIRMIQRKPVLDAEKCTGCGMCIYHCEAVPSAFQFDIPDEVTVS